MTFDETFGEIKATKDKYRISHLLNELATVEPQYDYLDSIKELITNKSSEIKWSAIGLLSNYSLPALEKYFINLLENENPDNISLAKAVQGLSINGTETSIQILIDVFKKSRDGQVRGVVIHTLRSIYLRNEISETGRKPLFKFIGNAYPFFQGYWNDIGKAHKTSLSTWKEIALSQLHNNSLNILFELNEEIDTHINIEKMNSHFIRYINVTVIFKNFKSSTSKYYTPREFYLSENRLFDSIFEKTKIMRADNNASGIISLIDDEILPKLKGRIQTLDRLKSMSFSDFKTQEGDIYKGLYGTDWDFVVANQLINCIDLFEDNPDKDLYIDLVLQKWNSVNKESFIVSDYLRGRKKRQAT